jgi:multiple sugar transport system permease protein
VADALDAPAPGRRRSRSSGGDLFGMRGAIGFVAPAAALIAVFLLVPALWTLYLGLTNRRLYGPQARHSEFIGLENYRDALNDEQFKHSLWVTVRYVFGSAIVGQAVLGFTLAWLFRNWQTWTRRLLELVVVFAWIIPGSVVAYLWRAFLSEEGTLNLLLPFNPRWLIDHELLSITIYNTWRGTAFSMLLFGAALNSLPPSYLETARLAGASTRQQLTGVVLPSIKGYILTNLLLISLWTFNDFGPFLLIGGGLGRRTEVLPVFLYNEAFSAGTNLGYGSAIAAIIMVINLVVATIYLRAGRQRRPATT